MRIMTADQFPGHPGHAERHSSAPTGHSYTLKSAALVFSGVALSLAGVFAVVEYSARQSRAMVDADIKTIAVRLNTQHEAITGISDRVGRLEASVDYRFARIDQRFDRIDERFEKIEERFEKIDERFEKLEAKFDRRFERLETKMDQKLDTVTALLIQLVDQKVTSPAASGASAAKRPR